MTEIQVPSLHFSPERGGRRGERCFGHSELKIGIYLGFGIWDLEFSARL
jgi:hypothetical protein